jgi:FkbM family methyltransferase
MGFDLLVLVNEDVGRRMAFLGRYETRDAEYLAAQIRPGDICLDVGANTGYYTMLMAKAAPQGVVHSFEPVKINFHLLGGGIELNHLGNVVPNNAALGAQSGEMSFSQSSDGAYSSLKAVGRHAELRQIKVAVDTIDDYMRSQSIPRIDVIKVDVEGAEGLVLDGATGIFNSPTKKPRVAMLELSDVNLHTYGSSIDNIVEKMTTLGYRPLVIEVTGQVVPFEQHHHDIYPNAFFLRDDPGKS